MAEPATDSSTRRASIAAPAGARLLPIVVRALDDAGVPVEDIALRRPTLDEVFLELTGRTAGASATDNQNDDQDDDKSDKNDDKDAKDDNKEDAA